MAYVTLSPFASLATELGLIQLARHSHPFKQSVQLALQATRRQVTRGRLKSEGGRSREPEKGKTRETGKGRDDGGHGLQRDTLRRRR